MKYLVLILMGLALTGCRETPVPAPADKPVEKPAAATQPERPDTMGRAIGDVITQRPVIEAGKRAKVQIESAAAKENAAIEDVLQE
jgi:hypothetical protein